MIANRLAPLIVLTLISTGCAGELREVGREPSLTPVGSGLSADQQLPVNFPTTSALRQPPNSTWRDTGADLFRDGRALRPGDVVTVKIQIKDRASLDNSLNRSRDSKAGLNSSLGYDAAIGGLAAKGNGKADASLGSKTSTDSKGAIARSENIDLLVAAVVTEVLPNGNMIVNGSQEVRVNFEVRVLNVAGIIRGRDIAQDNTISYDKLAEARISYGGRGRVMEVQQPGWGHQILDLVSPF
ncbi:MAG: flagellar basal body L-ring protein FlgH [Hyphomicrobium sp.]